MDQGLRPFQNSGKASKAEAPQLGTRAVLKKEKENHKVIVPVTCTMPVLAIGCLYDLYSLPEAISGK